MVEIRQIVSLGPELDFLALAFAGGETGNVRDRVSRWMRSGLVVGVVPGIYVTAQEFRKRPVCLELLANMIYGPSYVSFEYVLSRSGLIPEAVTVLTSATVKRNRDVDTPLGRFSYRYMPREAYSFGILRQELPDGAGYLVARPEKALLDLVYRSGALRSVRALEARLYEDLRIDPELMRELDRELLMSYSGRMPGATFRVQFKELLRRFHG